MGNDTIDKFLGDNGLIPINVPSLDSPSYVSDWNDAFQNVKTNLSILANKDFVKGETGDSSVMQVEPLMIRYDGDDALYITEYGWRMMNVICPNGVIYNGHGEFPFALSMCKFNEEGIFAPVTGKIKKTVYNEHGTHEVEEDVTYHWYSQFIEKNDAGEPTAGNVYVISEKNGLATVDETSPYSSLYYTFLDRRFYNSCGDSISEEIYETLEDLSCVLNLVPDDSTVFTYKKYDAFPTMYYEENTGMCWKINGAKTGMPIRGIPGADGKNAVLHIMKAERTKNESECRITEIFDNGFKTLSDIDTIKSLNGQSAIVFVLSDDKEEKNNFYFSKMYLNDSSDKESDWFLLSYCDETNALNTQIAYNDFINVLKAINLYKSDTEAITTLKGLFIPIENAVVESENTEGEETESTVLTTQAVHLMTAVTNKDNASENEEKPNLLFTPIANINSTSSDDYQLYINTYLYLEYDRKLIFGSADNSDESKEFDKLGEGWGHPSTHVVKYGLAEYINNSEAVQTLNLEANFPDEIKSAIETNGIYHWTLVESKNTNYDVDELINAFDSGYSFNSELNNIYTLTSTPGVDADFYWYCPYPNFENDDEQPGWTKKKFIFKKLVPIVSGKTKSYSYAKDTTLNLNYNVNILGDDNLEGSHNLTVHGNLSSNSANIYGSLSAKDYKNINTSTVIRGEEGIELGKVLIDETTNEFGPTFVIDGWSGSITKSSSVNTNDVITSNVVASGNITGADISCQNFKLARNSNIGISADIISANNTDLGDDKILNNSSNVYINNAHHLKISKNENLKSITKENMNSAIKSSDLIPHINSKVPLFVNDNANIIVTNSSDIEDVYVEYSNTGTMPLNFRKYKSKENGINSLDFNATKDYNLYKTTSSKKSSIINQPPTVGSNPSSAAATEYDVNPKRSSWISDKTTWTLPENKDRAIAKFTIEQKEDNDVLVNKITFNLSEYVLYLGIHGRCHYGNWPQLKSGSNIKLKYYLGDANAPDMLNGFLFEDPTTYNFKDIDCEYVGINYVAEEYGGKDRYYYFKFAPYSKTVYSSSATFAQINNAFQTKKSVTIWVVPTITLSVQSENFRNTYKQIIFKGFKYYNTTNPTANYEITKTTLTNWPSGTYVTPTCEYSISRVIGEGTEHKSTTICDNGIVFTSGNYLFGIGYGENIYNHSSTTSANRYAKSDSGTNIWGTSSNPTTTISGDICLDGKPMLFYVDATKNGVSDWINSVNSNTAVKNSSKKIINFNYNRAINAIPLEDIFNVIRYVRTQHDDWKQFGL